MAKGHALESLAINKDYERVEAFLICSLHSVFKKIVATDGNQIEVTYEPTNYVTSGGLFTCRSTKLQTQFWIGLNGPRFFFIVYVNMKDADLAKTVFGFCFGGAKRVGWEFTYEPVTNEVLSIWGTLMTDKTEPLSESNAIVGVEGLSSIYPTKEGQFWLTDIGMMVQSFIRSSERNGIHAPQNMSPAPL